MTPLLVAPQMTDSKSLFFAQIKREKFQDARQVLSCPASLITIFILLLSRVENWVCEVDL